MRSLTALTALTFAVAACTRPMTTDAHHEQTAAVAAPVLSIPDAGSVDAQEVDVAVDLRTVQQMAIDAADRAAQRALANLDNHAEFAILTPVEGTPVSHPPRPRSRHADAGAHR